MMDSFFDFLNVRNKEEQKLKRKSNLRPYSDPDDERFEWMKKDFIEYLEISLSKLEVICFWHGRRMKDC